MSKIILAASFMAAFFALPQAALAKGEEFLTKAIQGNMAEMKMGELAQTKGQSQEVKSFGAMLVKDHGEANGKAMAAAKAMGVTPPTEPNGEQKKMATEMEKLSGATFDKAFAKHMVEDHKKDVAEYEKESKASDGQATSYASETLPTLRKHLEMAQSLTK